MISFRIHWFDLLAVQRTFKTLLQHHNSKESKKKKIYIYLGGLDSLLSIVQMPGGIPVSTTAINGAKNAALIAASIFALTDKALEERLLAFRKAQTEKVLAAEL